jgi:hypothetical protein
MPPACLARRTKSFRRRVFLTELRLGTALWRKAYVVPMLGTVGLTAILLVVLLFVLLFGSSQIPKFFRAVGGLGRDYRRGKKDDPSDSG